MGHFLAFSGKVNIMYRRCCHLVYVHPLFLFSRLADALAYVAETNYGVRDLLYYLDDYFLIQLAAAPLAQRKFQALSSLFRQLGIPLAKGADKLCPTVTIITFLGI